MKFVSRANILLLPVFFAVQQSFAHCPFGNDNVIRESRLVRGEGNRTVELLVTCQDDYALLQPRTGGLGVHEINIFSTCIEPTNTSANTPEVDPTEILNVFGDSSGISRTINVSAELGMECHYFGCFEKSITGDEAQLYYTFTTATCNWGPSSNRLHMSTSAHIDTSLQPSPSSASIKLRTTPTDSRPVTNSTQGSLIILWAFPLSVLGVLIVAATLAASCYTALKARRNRCISDPYTDRALTVLKIDKLDPYFNPIGFDVTSVHSDGTDYGYGNSTQNELQLVLQTTYLGSHTAEFSTSDTSSRYTASFSSGTKQAGMTSSKCPENESDSYVQFSSTSSSNISNSIPSTDPLQSNGDTTPVAYTAAAFSLEREVHTHDFPIKSTVQLSTARAATPLQPHIAPSTSDNPCGLQQGSPSEEYLTEDKQEFAVAPFYLAELESDAIDKLDESNDLDAQNISNQSEYVPNDFFYKDVSV